MGTRLKKPTCGFTLNADSRQAIGLVGWWTSPFPAGRYWQSLAPKRFGNIDGLLVNYYPYTLTRGWTYGVDGGSGALYCDAAASTRVEATCPTISFSGFSVAMWANWVTTGTTIATIQSLCDNNHGVGGFTFQDRPDLSKVLSFYVGGASEVDSTFQVGDGTWRHIVGTYDGTTARLYVDGKFNASVTTTAGTPQAALSWGKWQGGTRYLTGKIEEPRLYNRVLSAADVWSMYDPRTRWELRYVPGRRSYSFKPGGNIVKLLRRPLCGGIT